MEKDTSKIVEELGLCPDFQTFYAENKDYMVSGNLSALLQELIDTKGLKKSQVIKNAELAEVYGYQIFSGLRVPDSWLATEKPALLIGLRVPISWRTTEKSVTKGRCHLLRQTNLPFKFNNTLLYKEQQDGQIRCNQHNQ